MQYITILLLIVNIILIFVAIMVIKNSIENSGKKNIKGALGDLFTTVSDGQKSIGDLQTQKMDEIRKTLSDVLSSTDSKLSISLSQLEKRFETLEKSNEIKLENIRNAVEVRLETIQKDNNHELENMRKTVDEKLQKTMSDSFKLVNDRLQEVYVGLGEMKTLATGVGDLKKVLSNVKTRGILGEIQLGAILDEIMSPEQYCTNIATIPKSKNVVEFAIKLPGENGEGIYLPIDSKFPMDAYHKLLDAYDTSNSELINSAVKELNLRIKQFAKDISEKYIEPPYTTDFAIMFLPFEGLYSEVINRGMVNELQNAYHINVAGPSTMAAFLNSIQMGFKTLAIKKRSSEVWQTLAAVKTEFDKFSNILEKTQKNLDTINNDLTTLIGTRTNVIKRKLRDIEKLDESETKKLLDSE